MAKRDEYQPTELSLDDLEAASGGSLLGDFAGGFVAGTSKSSGEHLGYDNTSSAAAWGNSFGWAVAGIATAIPATTIGGLTFAGIKTSFDVAGDVAEGRLGAAAIDAGVGIATMGYGGIVAGEAKALGGIIGEGLKSAGIDKVVDDVKSYSGGDDRFSPTDQAAGHGSEVSASAATGGDDRFSPTDQAAGHGSEVSASAATGGDDRFSPADNSSNNSGLDSSGSGYSGGGGGYSGGDSGGGGGGGGE